MGKSFGISVLNGKLFLNYTVKFPRNFSAWKLIFAGNILPEVLPERGFPSPFSAGKKIIKNFVKLPAETETKFSVDSLFIGGKKIYSNFANYFLKTTPKCFWARKKV